MATSPRSACPYLDEADYGIHLVDEEGHSSAEWIMTESLISKVPDILLPVNQLVVAFGNAGKIEGGL